METLTTSSSEKEVVKKGVRFGEMVKCVTLGFKEGKGRDSGSLKIVESGLEDEVNVAVFDSLREVSGDEDVKVSSVVCGDSLDDIVKETVAVVQEGCDGFNAVDKNDEGGIGIRKGKKGRKKKVVESTECVGDTTPNEVKVEKDGVGVTGRVLRSRTMAMSGSAKVDESGINESLVGFKRQMEAECFDQTELLKEVNESGQLDGRPQKKQKRPGRPKTQGEAGLSKIKDVSFDEVEVQNEVNERSQLAGRPQKRQKCRGRPPKIQGECFDKIEIKKEVNARSQLAGIPQNKQKRRGRPSKTLSETGLRKKMKDGCFDEVDLQTEVNESSQLTGRQQKKIKMKKQKEQTLNLSTDTEQPDNNLSNAKGGKTGPKIQHVHNQDQESTKQRGKISGESNDHTAVEVVKGDATEQLNTVIEGQKRREIQQLVRDQIVSMIMKAKWTIEYRPRDGRQYLDAVYVDPKGKTHWSITKAYFCLKKKIETGDADTNEISAFTPIPDEQMNVLFRSVSKVRSDKNQKKNKRGKNARKAEIVISGEAQLKKILNKKGKGGKKRKESHNSAVKLANLSNVKVKKDKSESAVQRRPKESKKGGQSRKPCLVARSSGKGLDQDNDDCEMYNGKRNIFSWMIDSSVITPGGKLSYGEGRRRNRSHEGQVTVDGIHCSCCDEILDISSFVSHGDGKLDQALRTIYYQSGASLLTCLLESWRKEEGLTNIRFNHVDVKGDDPNDDTCNICGDGGDLICCDGCPSTFHQSCLEIQSFPSGDWNCIYCCCKFCGLVACGASHPAPSSKMITCCLCEEKCIRLVHHSCLQEEDLIHVGSSSLSFCGRECHELYEQLQTYIGVKFELKDGYSWTLLKRYDLSQYLDDPIKVECNSKLAVAFHVMDECFEPIIDERSGVNRIHNVVYNCGSNFRRLDYSGFFTAILEKGGELISAASIRIHGNQLAEMPFIGTRNMYRRQGMCRRLLDAIEDALCSLGVDELVIPAIPELYKTWTEAFGFKTLEELLRQAMKGMSLIVFPGTDMLHKPLIKNQCADENLCPVAVSGDKVVEGVTVENDDNALSSEQTLATDFESKTPISLKKSEVQFLPSDDEHKSVGLVNSDVTGVKMSPLTSQTVPKNDFDLNLQPAATDIDIQSIDDESTSRDRQACKSPFKLSDSMAQSDNTTTQPLVLV